ncbi:MAG: methyltransferase domain-containing protein [Phycisphaerae bacterium]|nr:methyltransferase domain-containing protein [Phycisphaerae bacterium]
MESRPHSRLETIACPLCGESQQRELAVRADGLRVVRCDGCGLAFVNPRPIAADIARLYAADYFAGAPDTPVGYSGYAPTAGTIRSSPPRAYRLIRRDGPAVRGLRALDVGCAFGGLVYWLSQGGAAAMGIDVSADAVRFGREKLGLDLRCGTLETLDEPDGSFDLVTLVDVIEHVPDLAAALRRLARLLKPGGLAIVHTPNFGAFAAVGLRYKGLHLNLEHLLYFDRETLERAFAEVGLAAERPTRALVTCSANIDEFLAAARRGCGVGDRIRSLPGMNVLRRLRHRLLPPADDFRFDSTFTLGATLIARFHNPR